MRRSLRLIIGLLFIVVFSYFSTGYFLLRENTYHKITLPTHASIVGVEEEVVVGEVLRVIDGDTLEVMIEGVGHRVRLIGLDAPEEEREGRQAECFALEASNWLKGKLKENLLF